MRPSPLPRLFGTDVRRIHCLGVGGMGVAPLAIYLARSGWSVSGEDDALSAEVAALLAAAGVAAAFNDLANPERHTKIIVEPWR